MFFFKFDIFFFLITIPLLISRFDQCCCQDGVNSPTQDEIDAEELKASELLSKFDDIALEGWLKIVDIVWDGYENNKLEEPKTKMRETTEAYDNMIRENYNQLKQFKNWPYYKNSTVSRLMRLSVINPPKLLETTSEEYVTLVDKLTDHQLSEVLCTSKEDKECKSTVIQLNKLMEETEDVEKLRELWLEPKVKLGLNEIRWDYKRISELWDIAAKEQNYKNAIEFKLEVYGLADDLYDNSMVKHWETLWKEVKHFYQKLHAVCLDLLMKHYNDECLSQAGLMPAIYVGQFGQDWNKYSHIFNLYNKTENYQIIDINAVMENMEPKRTQKDYAILASELISSMKMIPLPEDYIENSYFQEGEYTNCDWYWTLNYYDGKRVRIIKCAKLNMDDISDIYGLTSECETFLQYNTKTTTFQGMPTTGLCFLTN